jgi:tRNA(adenine34) deaminase
VADEAFMELALDEAAQAASIGEVPVGCVVVGADGRVLGSGHNERESLADPTAHAAILALRRAAAARGHWRLVGATVYVTLEPCPMCAGAMVNARVDRVVWGADDPKAGAMRTLYAIGLDGKLNHTVEVEPGVLGERCAEVLSGFFSGLRARR